MDTDPSKTAKTTQGEQQNHVASNLDGNAAPGKLSHWHIAEPGQPNIYAYCLDNPWTHFDPEGLKIEVDKNAPKAWQKQTAKDLKQLERNLAHNYNNHPNSAAAKKDYNDFKALKNDRNYKVIITPEWDMANGNAYYQKALNTPGQPAPAVHYMPWKYFGGNDASGSSLRPPSIGLGHEIAHAIDEYHGTFNNTPGSSSDPNRFPNSTEEAAVGFENQVRAGHYEDDPKHQRPKY